MNFTQQRVKDINYGIRRRQRGLMVWHKEGNKLTIAQRQSIREINKLKDELEELTWSRVVTDPKWPT